MPNVFDYLAWRGDLTFAQSPFNEADSLILCRLAYIPFDGIAPASFVQAIPLADAGGTLPARRAAAERDSASCGSRRSAGRQRGTAAPLSPCGRRAAACRPCLQPAAVFAMHGSQAM